MRACGVVAAIAGAVIFGSVSVAVAQPDPSFAPLQDAAADDPFEGRVIRELVIRTPTGVDEDGQLTFGRLRPEIENRARNAIRAYVGGPYRAETVRGDIERLSRLISFGTVRTSLRPLDDGSIELFYTLTERPVIQDVQVTGNRDLTDQRLAQEVGDVLVGGPVERFQIDRAARRIERLYRERGYYNAEVRVDEEELEENAIVLFRIREGNRVRVTDIRFVGNDSISRRLLRREIETEESGFLRRGAIEPRVLDADVAALITFYRDRGYLDVRADRRVRESADGSEAIIEFLIDEGPRYTFRSLRVEHVDEAEPLFDVEQLEGLMTIRPGDIYGAGAIRSSVEAIADAYGSLGHVDVSVAPSPLRDPERPQVDLLLRIDPGPRYKTGEVIIVGNDITKQNVIRRHVEVLPGQTLSSVGIERSERRIERLRLFNPQDRDRGVKLTLQPPDPVEPEFRDLLIEVDETNTGDISFGGTVSSDAGLGGSVSITQRNFDVSDTPDSFGEYLAGRAFRGAGQTFNLTLAPGINVETYSVGLSEPYLFETDYTGSAVARYRRRDFDEYDETRIGGTLSLGRRFGTRWNGSASVRIDQVSLGSIPDSAAVDIVESQGDAVILGLGFRLSRSTLDRGFLPERGSITSLGVEQVVGDFEFTALSGGYEVFFPIRGDFLGRATVLSIATRARYIPQGQDAVPVYERFYQGGQAFRGFNFRTVSPRTVRADNGEPSPDPVGGTWSFYTGFELRQPLVEESVYVVGFVDTGTVLDDIGFSEYRVSAGVGLRLAVPQLSPAPLAFDFGFPIVSEDGDEDRIFSFSIDVPF